VARADPRAGNESSHTDADPHLHLEHRHTDQCVSKSDSHPSPVDHYADCHEYTNSNLHPVSHTDGEFIADPVSANHQYAEFYIHSFAHSHFDRHRDVHLHFYFNLNIYLYAEYYADPNRHKRSCHHANTLVNPLPQPIT
jgi:hypothetical protein